MSVRARLLVRLLDALSLVLCTAAAPALLAGEWLRDLADALRYREIVLERIELYTTFDD